MGFSQAQKIESRERILSIAAKQIRERGFESIKIADLMKDAGLTVGAFYGHFASRDDLIEQATQRAAESGVNTIHSLIAKSARPTLENVVDAFFSSKHVRNAGEGCSVCALAGEAKSAPKAVRAKLTATLQEQLTDLAKILPGAQAEKRAISIMTSMIGAVTLARSVTDSKLADSILQETKRAILDSATI